MTTTIALVLQFIISVLLAFIAFVLQNLRSDMATALQLGQDNQVAIGRMDSKLDAISSRLDRLERHHDDKR